MIIIVIIIVLSIFGFYVLMTKALKSKDDVEIDCKYSERNIKA